MFGSAFGQKGTQSPYSSYGIGELNYEGYALFSSMGGIAMGNTDSSIVNSFNPASYAYLGRNKPVFQLGINGRLSNFATSNSNTNRGHFGLNQFQLGLPIKKNWGVAIGVRPYSFTGYEITKFTAIDGDTSIQAVNEGSGGIRIANFGLSYRPLNASKRTTIKVKATERDSADAKGKIDLPGFRTHNLSLGVNANYLFGTSKQIRSTEFIGASIPIFNARVEDGVRVSGLSLEVGLNYQFGFKSTKLARALSIGATYSPATEINANQDLVSFTYVGSFYRGIPVSVLDTIQSIQDNEGAILRPEAIRAGFEYRLTPRGENNSLLRIGADISFERWSTFYTRFSEGQNSGGLKDRLSLGLGLEWTPYTGANALNNTTPYLGKIHYRLGFNYIQTELLIENNLGNQVAIDNYGMSFGLGLPISVSNSNTNINFGASLGNLGETNNGLIRERYLGLFVGFSITPGDDNKWFVKRKYN